MSILRARTHLEAYDYMRLAAGEPCRNHPLEIGPTHAEVGPGEPIVTEARVFCPVDDRTWTYSFVAEQERPEDERFELVYGYGSQPSSLIDAGEFLWLVRRYTGAAETLQGRFPGVLPDLESASSIVRWMEQARQAALEVEKFIPAGEERVPEPAIWSPLGREIRQHRDSELNRATVQAIVGQLDRAIAEYEAAYSGR